MEVDKVADMVADMFADIVTKLGILLLVYPQFGERVVTGVG